MMRNLELFGESPAVHVVEPESRARNFRLKSLRPVFKTEVVREDAPSWLTDKVTSAATVYEMFKDLVQETKEVFICLHLNTKNQVIAYEQVSVGSLSGSIVHPREVFKGILLSSAAAAVVVHNHPSGVPDPSSEDINITKRLVQGGELLGVRILDHVIIGDGKYYSFADQGRLNR